MFYADAQTEGQLGVSGAIPSSTIEIRNESYRSRCILDPSPLVEWVSEAKKVCPVYIIKVLVRTT